MHQTINRLNLSANVEFLNLVEQVLHGRVRLIRIAEDLFSLLLPIHVSVDCSHLSRAA